MRLFYLIMMLSSSCFAQKYEREYRIEVEEVPEQALHFMSHVSFDKIKWYREESLSKTTIEAKAKQDGTLYSIEFSADGIIEDIEIKTQNTPAFICTFLHDNYEAYRIRRAQIQHLGTEDDLIAFMNDKEIKTTLNYEIVAKVKEDNSYQLVEFLFSSSGELLRKDEIVSRNNDILDY